MGVIGRIVIIAYFALSHSCSNFLKLIFITPTLPTMIILLVIIIVLVQVLSRYFIDQESTQFIWNLS